MSKYSRPYILRLIARNGRLRVGTKDWKLKTKLDYWTKEAKCPIVCSHRDGDNYIYQMKT